MRITTAILSTFLLVLAAANCNGDDMPPNLPGEFGEPCIDGALVGTPDGCVEGLSCWDGYCEESCAKDQECRSIEGWQHICLAGQCVIPCDANDKCPDTLGTALVCEPIGTMKYCEADDDP